MTNEIKVIYDVHNETVRVNNNGATIFNITDPLIPWEDKKIAIKLFIYNYVVLSSKSFRIYEATF